MNQVDERQRSINAKLERLRKRAQRLAQDDSSKIIEVGIILGLIDVLADEL